MYIVRTRGLSILPYLVMIVVLLTLQIEATNVIQVNNGTQLNMTAVEIVYIGNV
jgi:hypothetical protein